MKNIIIILLAFTLTANAQERKQKCVTLKVEKIEDYRVRITKTDTCKNIITVTTMLEKDWRSRKKKRKTRKKKN
tara:strand:- start:101 stop:322 length:222 start_codon:yes stop_codon:yes gene_type:complete